MKSILFDCETGPLPEAELLQMMPQFNPDEVKCGNMKDPDKIAAKIEEARANHEKNFIEQAALSALTGQVVAIGWKYHSESTVYIVGQDAFKTEKEVLEEFWTTCRTTDDMRVAPLIGFNSSLFDLPFLFRRSWKHGIRPPDGYRSGRYWANHTDLRDVWQLGDKQAHGSLEAIAKHFGLAGKTGSGKDFAALWNGSEEQHKLAVDYLTSDILLTEQVAIRMGVTL